jgi:hypothetical protein
VVQRSGLVVMWGGPPSESGRCRRYPILLMLRHVLVGKLGYYATDTTTLRKAAAKSHWWAIRETAQCKAPPWRLVPATTGTRVRARVKTFLRQHRASLINLVSVPAHYLVY